MNNACPSCGAVYAVTAKDVGRKIKCKKCSSALRVDDDGLVMDGPAAARLPAATPVAAEVANEFDTGDEGLVSVKKKGRKPPIAMRVRTPIAHAIGIVGRAVRGWSRSSAAFQPFSSAWACCSSSGSPS